MFLEEEKVGGEKESKLLKDIEVQKSRSSISKC